MWRRERLIITISSSWKLTLNFDIASRNEISASIFTIVGVFLEDFAYTLYRSRSLFIFCGRIVFKMLSDEFWYVSKSLALKQLSIWETASDILLWPPGLWMACIRSKNDEESCTSPFSRSCTMDITCSCSVYKYKFAELVKHVLTTIAFEIRGLLQID